MTQPWTGSPFDPAMALELRTLIGRLDVAQRQWLCGYLAGNLEAIAAPSQVISASPPAVTILYGSHSGNCESLARLASSMLAQRGLSSVTLDMIDCRKSHLTESQQILVIVSTHGEGDPPERAVPLYELLSGRKAPRLEHLQYSVLALGDSSYEKFCETGRQFDDRFEALGATRLQPRAECDVDFTAAASVWIEAVAGKLTGSAAIQTAPAFVNRPAAAIANAYTRKNPFHAPVLTNQRLTTSTSSKDVRHLELSLQGSGIHYEPGDALGVVPANSRREVDALLEHLTFDTTAEVDVGARKLPLYQALQEHLDIGLVTRSLLDRYASARGIAVLSALLQPGQEVQLQQYLHGRHLIDLLQEHPLRDAGAQDFARLLRPMAPRLYSIASSARASPDEVHLTVSVVNYSSFRRERQGTVSGPLAALVDEDARVPVYLHRNPGFRLPTDNDASIIMIGPGTGIAPFRSFLAEREAVGASGRNWLFFGDRRFRDDFLYQAEWLQWRKSGLLHRINVAFSRETTEKIYVQHRLAEQGQDLFAWLENGAHLYVCGDAQFMAPDVERALLEVIERHGGRSPEQASQYLLQLQRECRYQKDVY